MSDRLHILYDASDMVCLVLGCKWTKIPPKSKFSRHWEERHKLATTKYLCSVSGCLAEFRRRSDMKTHIGRLHESDAEKVEFILTKCEVLQRENKGYLDRRLYVFREGCINGASNLAVITATQDHQEEDSVRSPTVTAVMQTHEKEKKDSLQVRQLL